MSRHTLTTQSPISAVLGTQGIVEAIIHCNSPVLAVLVSDEAALQTLTQGKLDSSGIVCLGGGSEAETPQQTGLTFGVVANNEALVGVPG